MFGFLLFTPPRSYTLFRLTASVPQSHCPATAVEESLCQEEKQELLELSSARDPLTCLKNQVIEYSLNLLSFFEKYDLCASIRCKLKLKLKLKLVYLFSLVMC